MFCWVFLLLASSIYANSGLFSLQYFKKSPGTISVTYGITLNGNQIQSNTISVPETGSDWINFSAGSSSVILVSTETTGDNFDLFYQVRRGSDGSGTLQYSSKSNLFRPPNECYEERCRFAVEDIADAWGNSKATFYADGIPVLVDYNESIQTFNADEGSPLKVEFTHAPESGSRIAFQLSVGISEIQWYYDSYGSKAIIPVTKSPTNGYLYPISHSQITDFAKLLNLRGEILNFQ